jgi:hypothetical protein
MSTIKPFPVSSKHIPLLNAYANSHPFGFAVLVTIAFAIIMSSLIFLLPRPVENYPLAVIGYDAVRYIMAIGLLTALGW